ncbi:MULTISPECIES: hypothetical protein [unclassified Janthinobacterium]|uniref:hypothetical protein n=1 Tax=unclassified Janthinobacterium TaxID=2610881 RepID=UPI001609220F|nr:MULTISPECIES: hypothetical protein [unclassified Janthinobacterium]MBB5605833.1 DNA-binding response OmpR family regulator [Janthinobacterium sp. S3T4]MBB5611248.1 DNA-binding response OmpR family regulator [Janthinobacterium sp. S3M3]
MLLRISYQHLYACGMFRGACGAPLIDGVHPLHGFPPFVPLICVAVRSDGGARPHHGVEIGAGDYVIRLFSARQLAARICTILRRADATITLRMTGMTIAVAVRRPAWLAELGKQCPAMDSIQRQAPGSGDSKNSLSA